MGWFGYSNYSGDGTQTLHYNFIKWSGVATEDEVMDGDWLGRKTKIPKEKIPLFVKNINKTLKKMPSVRFFNEDTAINWQMLLSLFLDNKIKACPKIVIRNGLFGSAYLLGEHSDDFDRPSLRRQNIKNFMKRVGKFYNL